LHVKATVKLHQPRRASGRGCIAAACARLALLCALCAALGPGCKRGPSAVAAQGGDSLAAMRLRVATDPEDIDARVALARLERAAGRPGGAFAQLAVLDRADVLPSSERRDLAALYAQRFEERLALGDGGAHADAAAALRLDPGLALAAERRAEGYFLATLAGLRRANLWGRREARRMLARAAALAPGDPRLAARLATVTRTRRPPEIDANLGPRGRNDDAEREDRAPLPEPAVADLGVAALWLHHGGAHRAALDLLELYLDRGGRDREALQALVAERAWWSGDGGAPGLLLARTLREAGVSLCPLTATPDEPGCGDSLWAVAERDPALGRAIWQRAGQRFWYTADPRQAAAWSLLATAAWLDGEGAPATSGELLAARVDAAAMTGSVLIPDHAEPAIWRAAGNADRAAAALDRVVDRVLKAEAAAPATPATPPAAPDDLSPGAQALIVAEAAIQGRPAEIIDALRARLPGAGALGWQSAVHAAYTSGDRARLEALLAEQPGAAPAVLARHGALGPLAWRHGRRVHALAWWLRLLGRDARLSPGRDAVWRAWRELVPMPPGWSMPPATVTVPAAALVTHEDPAIAAALVAVAEASAREPAVADRLARDLVARAVSPGRHGPDVARLLAAVGEHERALAWWERIAAESPAHPPYLVALGLAAAEAGDVLRAHVHIEAAAARSGDAGATLLVAAAALSRRDHALDAVASARKALLLAPPGHRGPVLALLATTMHVLGRADDAAVMRAAWLDDVPGTYRARAEAALGHSKKAAAAMPGTGTAERALPPAPADVAALAAAALLAPPDRARDALVELADALAALGAPEAARAAHAAARAAEALVPAPAPALPPLP
jgi:tetratricopeptide (TPR) repeat protein